MFYRCVFVFVLHVIDLCRNSVQCRLKGFSLVLVILQVCDLAFQIVHLVLQLLFCFPSFGLASIGLASIGLFSVAGRRHLRQIHLGLLQAEDLGEGAVVVTLVECCHVQGVDCVKGGRQ